MTPPILPPDDGPAWHWCDHCSTHYVSPPHRCRRLSSLGCVVLALAVVGLAGLSAVWLCAVLGRMR